MKCIETFWPKGQLSRQSQQPRENWPNFRGCLWICSHYSYSRWTALFWKSGASEMTKCIERKLNSSVSFRINDIFIVLFLKWFEEHKLNEKPTPLIFGLCCSSTNWSISCTLLLRFLAGNFSWRNKIFYRFGSKQLKHRERNRNKQEKRK